MALLKRPFCIINSSISKTILLCFNSSKVLNAGLFLVGISSDITALTQVKTLNTSHTTVTVGFELANPLRGATVF